MAFCECLGLVVDNENLETFPFSESVIYIRLHLKTNGCYEALELREEKDLWAGMIRKGFMEDIRIDGNTGCMDI